MQLNYLIEWLITVRSFAGSVAKKYEIDTMK